MKKMTFGDSSSALSTNKIPIFENSSRSADKTPSTIKTPLKLIGNTLNKEHQAWARPQTNNKPWQLTICFEYQQAIVNFVYSWLKLLLYPW